MGVLTLSAAQAAFGTTDTARLTGIVDAANARVERVTGRKFVYGSYTETTDGKGGGTILLPETPINVVSSVTVVGLNNSTTAIDSTLYTVDKESGVLGFRESRPATIANKVTDRVYGVSRGRINGFADGFENVSVTYTGGLSAGDPELALVKEVTLRIAQSDWLQRSQDLGLASESIGQYSYTRMTSAEMDTYITDRLGSLSAGVL